MTTFVQTQGFNRGEVDESLYDRTDADFYTSAFRRMQNWLPDLVGSARVRDSTFLAGFGAAPAPIPANYEDIWTYLFEFRNRRVLVLVSLQNSTPAPATERWVAGIGYAQLVGGATDAPVLGPTVFVSAWGLPQRPTPERVGLLSENVSCVQIGPSLFLASRFFPPIRIFLNLQTNDIQGEVITFREELLGVTLGTNGSTTFSGTDTVYQSQLAPGDVVEFAGQLLTVATVPNNTSFTTTTPFTGLTQTGRLAKLRPFSVTARTGTVYTTSGSTTLSGVGTLFTTEVAPGQTLLIGNVSVRVASVVNNTTLIMDQPWSAPLVPEVANPQPYFRLNSDPFNGDWPRCVTANKGRLIFASTFRRPTALWASKPNEPFRLFGAGVEDDRPINVELLAPGLDDIAWLCGTDRLYLGSTQAEFAIGEPDQVLTPLNFGVRRIGTTGSAPIQPVTDGSVIYHVNNTRTQILGVRFDFGVQAFASNDITLLAPHLFEAGIKEIALRPPVRWDRTTRLFALVDGQIQACAIAPGQNVLAWSPAPLAPRETRSVRSLAGCSDFLAVYGQDTAGVGLFFLNVFSSVRTPYTMDFARKFTSIPASGLITVPGFYAGLTVTVWSALRGPLGEATLPNASPTTLDVNPFRSDLSLTPQQEFGEIVIGFPFEAVLTTLDGRYETRGGSITSRPRRLVRAILGLLDTPQLIVNNLPLLGQSQSVAGPALPPRTGKFEVRNLGWDRVDELEIRNSGIFPARLTSIVREYSQ